MMRLPQEHLMSRTAAVACCEISRGDVMKGKRNGNGNGIIENCDSEGADKESLLPNLVKVTSRVTVKRRCTRS